MSDYKIHTFGHTFLSGDKVLLKIDFSNDEFITVASDGYNKTPENNKEFKLWYIQFVIPFILENASPRQIRMLAELGQKILDQQDKT